MVYFTSLKAIGIESFMCGCLNQFANIPALSVTGKTLRIERRKKKGDEDKEGGGAGDPLTGRVTVGD